MSNSLELNKLVKITGKIVYVVFRSDETMYTVLKFQLNDSTEKVITVTGILPDIGDSNELYDCYGDYVEHPKYGMQFQAVRLEESLPEEREGVIRYLSGIAFPGIGKVTAEKIVNHFGEDCLEKIRENPDLLYQVDFLNEEKIETLKNGILNSDRDLQDLICFLSINGIGIRNIIRLNKTYGSKALEKIKENPYRVIDECDGFGFKTADKIAESLGIQKDDERRLYALLVSLVMTLCMQTGDSYILIDTLRYQFEKYTSNYSCDFDGLLYQAKMRHRIIQEKDRIYPISQYESEKGIATYLSQFPYTKLEEIDSKDVDEYLDTLQEDMNIYYDDNQLDAIRAIFKESFTILTGGPGSGKTTVVQAINQAFKHFYPNALIQCVAPTGRAAKRLEETTGTHATTIHSLLKWDLELNQFGMNEENPINVDCLIIDEFSMVDTWLFYNLLKASANVKKIYIIGDEDQLPSVSPGSVLRDLIATDQFHLVRLKHIYRQKDGSDIITLAHDMTHGDANFEELCDDVAFFECSRYQIKDNVVHIFQSALDKGYSISDVQVLSPMYAGPAGIDILNVALQDLINPANKDKNEVKYGYRIFREGDKILQLKNQPDDDVYNGDIGILEEIIPSTESKTAKPTLLVNFNGNYVEYSAEQYEKITHAYCISVHKAQGSEYPIVILPITYQFYHMLQRKLLYTAVTRAKQSLVLLGEKGAFYKGIETLEKHIRQTTLVEAIQQAISEDDIFC